MCLACLCPYRRRVRQIDGCQMHAEETPDVLYQRRDSAKRKAIKADRILTVRKSL